MCKVNLFVDMDGVLVVYDKNTPDLMYDKNFFLNRPAIKPMLELVKRLANKDYNVYILTSVINSKYCIEEKAQWLDQRLPQLKKNNRIYVPYGVVKSDYAQQKVDTDNSVNVLIDDYTENLDKWKLNNALPIKVMNGINGTGGTWVDSGGNFIDAYSNVQENIDKITTLIDELKVNIAG